MGVMDVSESAVLSVPYFFPYRGQVLYDLEKCNGQIDDRYDHSDHENIYKYG